MIIAAGELPSNLDELVKQGWHLEVYRRTDGVIGCTLTKQGFWFKMKARSKAFTVKMAIEAVLVEWDFKFGDAYKID